MDIELSPVEARVIGALIEKSITTPKYYPLTLNALTNACNQKSNRNPVVALEETTVFRALEQLMDRGLARRVIGDDSRVPKYREVFTERMDLTPPQTAIACVLLLRGPQTPGEIRGRTERLHRFESLQDVTDTLDAAQSSGDPWIRKLPRQAGTKERRYAHLFSGDVEVGESEPVEPAAVAVQSENERIATLESGLAALREDFARLQQEFAEFRRQFE